MKLILLAATAMFAAPVMAQTTPAPAPADQTMTAPAPADAAPPPPPAQATMPPAETTGSPAGGYAPTGPAITGGTPGSNLPPVFRPAPTPDQAFPPPPAQESYPICKKGQYDGCMQASQAPHKMKAKRRARR